ncbi:hypothetical protein [Neorhodopirellula lusitana]|uniref:hypothetical protein n=1 Tax=Neorhodopirellula lusitana TaxID=445327 RepID=UPI00384BFDE2
MLPVFPSPVPLPLAHAHRGESIGRHWIAAACVWLSLVFAGTVHAVPQTGFGGSGNGATAAANEVTEFEGKLKGVRGNIVTVTRDDGVDCLVMFPKEADLIEFSATALPAYLRRGMLVRFSSVLGPTGMPLAPVDRIEIFAPVNPATVSGSGKDNYTPGVHSASKERKARNAPMTGKVTVVGSLLMLSPDGRLGVQAGKTPVQTMVSPQLKLEIRANNLSMAQEGEAVKVSGFYQPPDDTKVQAERITVTTDRIFGETPPPAARRTRRTRKEKEAQTKTEATAETPEVEAADVMEAE